MENTNSTQSIKKQGNLNPMFGKKHDLKTKKKISNSQKERYEAIRQAVYSEDAKLDEPIGRTDKAARIDLLNQCLNTDTIGFDSVEQAHNFVAIMLQEKGENYLEKVVKEELNKFLNDRNRHA